MDEFCLPFPPRWRSVHVQVPHDLGELVSWRILPSLIFFIYFFFKLASGFKIYVKDRECMFGYFLFQQFSCCGTGGFILQ